MLRLPAVLAAACLTAGCSAPGFLYTDITQPLTVDMAGTPRASDSATGYQREIREPFTGTGIRAEWAGYAPGETARDGGLESIHYADIRRRSFVGGIWRSTTALVYGNRQDAPVAVDGARSAANAVSSAARQRQ